METVAMRPMLLAGSWQGAGSGATDEVHDPATGQAIATVPRGDEATVRIAVQASRAAFEDPTWKQMDPAERGRILNRMAQKTYAHAKELAELESRNNGKTFREALGDVRFAAWTLEYFAGWTDKLHGDTIPVPGDRLSYTLRQPVGVTAHIVPWNFPLQLAVRSIAPALAAGGTVIAKPASLTPLSLLRWAEIVEDTGLPTAVLQVITGPGRAVGGALAAHPGVDSVTLTGSVATGKQVMHAAAENLTPVTLELGGKGAHIVRADADVQAAAKGICYGIFMNAGQMCWAGSRLIVHKDVAEELVAAIQAEAAKWKIGPGMEEGVRIGSMVSQDQRASVLQFITQGVAQGAKVVYGGKVPDDPALADGAFLEPTILTGVTPDNVCWKEEIFGPVLSVCTVTDDDEALRLANDSTFGLLNGVWTRDVGAAHRLARNLQSGMVSINEYPVTFPQTPFSGWKHSGIGVEQGRAALDFYTRIKHVNVRLG